MALIHLFEEKYVFKFCDWCYTVGKGRLLSKRKLQGIKWSLTGIINTGDRRGI